MSITIVFKEVRFIKWAIQTLNSFFLSPPPIYNLLVRGWHQNRKFVIRTIARSLTRCYALEVSGQNSQKKLVIMVDWGRNPAGVLTWRCGQHKATNAEQNTNFHQQCPRSSESRKSERWHFIVSWVRCHGLAQWDKIKSSEIKRLYFRTAILSAALNNFLLLWWNEGYFKSTTVKSSSGFCTKQNIWQALFIVQYFDTIEY